MYTGLDSSKTASKKAVHKASELLGDKISDELTKSNDDKIVQSEKMSRNVEEINTSLEKRVEILDKLRNVL